MKRRWRLRLHGKIGLENASPIGSALLIYWNRTHG
jgi:hypothetical protein